MSYFHGPYLAARAFLFSRVFLGMVALDAWTLMIGHAGRYGVAGFNVAHFRWLDWIVPVPTPDLYIAVLLLSGLLALTLALLGVRRVPMVALFLLYTYSWSMSMLDSYQHHYFVSLVMLCVVFFPKLTLADVTPARASDTEVERRGARSDVAYVVACGVLLVLYVSLRGQVMRAHGYVWFTVCTAALALATFLHTRRASYADTLTRGFGYPLLATTICILYTFTAVAKMDAQWCEGYTLRRISSAEEVFAPLLALAQQLGVSESAFWSTASTLVIPQELLIACGYLLSALQDATGKRWLRVYVTLSFALALSLHIGAEALRLEIGWFSYYMIMLACTFLLPGRPVQSLTRLVSWPAQRIASYLAEPAAGAPPHSSETWLTCTAASGVLAAAAYLIDLPGAIAASVLAALTLWGYAAYTRARKQPDAAAQVTHAALGLGVAALLMWTAISQTTVRWDYYRYLGGDLARRGESEAALSAYLKGERYAPRGQSRMHKIRKLQRQLGLPVSR